MIEQDSPTATKQFATPTGLRVRQDLYDEEYSDEDYEQMLSLYEGTMASIVEGEIVKSKVLRVTDNAVILDVGFKSEGSVPLDEFNNPQDLKEGDEVTAMVINVDRKSRSIKLSIKAKDDVDSQEAMKSLSAASERENAGTTSLGALLRAKMENKS